MELFFDLLKQLVRVPSVVGAEHPFFLFLMRELDEIGINAQYYDGILVAQGSEPDSGYISTHVDRHGLICTGKNEFQYAAFIAKNQADLTGKSNSEQILKNFTQRFVDEKVQAYEQVSGTYLGLGVIKDAYLCQRRNNIIFTIDGFSHLLPGTPIAFMDRLKIENGFVSAQLDNVLGVATLLYLYHCGYRGTAFFTASEEAGKSWRFLLEWFKRVDISTNRLLVLDTSPYKSLEETKNLEVVLRNRDSNASFRSPLKAEIKKIAIHEGIKYHFKDAYIKNKSNQEGTKLSLGTTELGRIINATKGKIQGATLQVPTTGYHTAEETASMESIEKFLYILKEVYLKNLQDCP